MTPFSTTRGPPGARPGRLNPPWPGPGPGRAAHSPLANLRQLGPSGYRGPGATRLPRPIRPSRSPTGPQAGGTTAKAHSPRAAVGGPSSHSGPASSPVWGGITAAAWGSTSVHPASGLPWTRIANPSVGQGNNSATQDALAIRVLRPAGIWTSVRLPSSRRQRPGE